MNEPLFILLERAEAKATAKPLNRLLCHSLTQATIS